jgi:hypothetical protein
LIGFGKDPMRCYAVLSGFSRPRDQEAALVVWTGDGDLYYFIVEFIEVYLFSQNRFFKAAVCLDRKGVS